MCAFLVLVTVGCKDSNEQPREVIEATLLGKLTEIPSPCETIPCLPGMVVALETDSIDYVITVNKLWFAAGNDVVVNNDTLKLNDYIEAFGLISERQDLTAKKYYEFEIIELKK